MKARDEDRKFEVVIIDEVNNIIMTGFMKIDHKYQVFIKHYPSTWLEATLRPTDWVFMGRWDKDMVEDYSTIHYMRMNEGDIERPVRLYKRNIWAVAKTESSIPEHFIAQMRMKDTQLSSMINQNMELEDQVSIMSTTDAQMRNIRKTAESLGRVFGGGGSTESSDKVKKK